MGDKVLSASRAKVGGDKTSGVAGGAGAAADGMGMGPMGGMGMGMGPAGAMGGYGATGSNAIPLGGPSMGPGGYGAGPMGGYGASAPSSMMMGGGSAAPVVPSGPTGVPTRCVLLEEMVTPVELMADSEYRDILEDVKGECGKYGALLQVAIPRPPTPGNGRVFLLYADQGSAITAATSLAGRQFASRNIRATYYDEGAFRASIFDL